MDSAVHCTPLPGDSDIVTMAGGAVSTVGNSNETMSVLGLMRSKEAFPPVYSASDCYERFLARCRQL